MRRHVGVVVGIRTGAFCCVHVFVRAACDYRVLSKKIDIASLYAEGEKGFAGY